MAKSCGFGVPKSNRYGTAKPRPPSGHLTLRFSGERRTPNPAFPHYTAAARPLQARVMRASETGNLRRAKINPLVVWMQLEAPEKLVCILMNSSNCPLGTSVSEAMIGKEGITAAGHKTVRIKFASKRVSRVIWGIRGPRLRTKVR